MNDGNFSACDSIYIDEQSEEFPECNQIQVNVGFVQYSVNYAALTSQESGQLEVKDIQWLSSNTETQWKLECELSSHLYSSHCHLWKEKWPLPTFILHLHVYKQSLCQVTRESGAPINISPEVGYQDCRCLVFAILNCLYISGCHYCFLISGPGFPQIMLCKDILTLLCEAFLWKQQKI